MFSLLLAQNNFANSSDWTIIFVYKLYDDTIIFINIITL